MFELPWIMLLVPLSIWWWAFVAVVVFFALWSMENEDSVAGIFILTALACIAYLVAGPGITVAKWIIDNPGTLAMWMGGYLAIGTCWCFFKWYGLALKAKNLYNYIQSEYNRGTKHTSWESFLYLRWSMRKYQDEDGNTCYRPVARIYKARITNWVLFWPASVVWTGAREWLLAITDFIYRSIGGALDSVSKWVWKDVDFK